MSIFPATPFAPPPARYLWCGRLLVQKPTTKDLAKLGICHPGQSYNPTEDDHEDVLATAVTVELRRQEAVDDERKPVSQGMSKETLDTLVGDDVREGQGESMSLARLLFVACC